MRRLNLLGCALLLAGCAAAKPDAGHAPMRLTRVVIADGLKSPWSIAFLNETQALVTEKEGGLLRVDLETGAVTPIAGAPADLVDDIRSEARFDNGGLFEVLLDPAFPESRWVYLSYAAKSPSGRTTKVVRARLRGDRLSDYETLFVAEPYTPDEFFHYGGGMAFGADAKLYVTIGERIYHEKSNPALPFAQDVRDRRGKIYRLNPDGSPPVDNPDFGEGAPPGLFALGIRAAQGVTAHPETGDIWFSEHGSAQGDEINRLARGANYGWPIITTGGYRDADYEPPAPGERDFVDPVWTWRQTVAPTGLAFYEGDAFPEWRGDLLVAGLSIGSLWRLNFEDGAIASVEELFTDDRRRSRKIAVSPAGAVYMLTDTLLAPDGAGGLRYTGEPGGQLLRIERARPHSSP